MAISRDPWRKEGERIALYNFVPAGYQTAHIKILLNGEQRYAVTFAVSPSNFNESRQAGVQLNKTTGGWFAQYTGPQPVSVTLDGFMLDIEGYLEKHKFLDNWARFLEAKKTDEMEYSNKYTFQLICMGREYNGFISAVSFSTSSLRPFLHQYNISFTSLTDRYIYKPDQEIVNLDSDTFVFVDEPEPTVISPAVYTILSTYASNFTSNRG